uniref:RRM domain-containing protein n=1 Tax=Lactuca sativa TaxID=4236 RepID=A0A9R1W7V6_LACSA|nr:hypothetical protein LSAT_V11C200073030 [Lactuca sativa]
MKIFNRYGTILDVYVAKKLNRINKKFGYVRFLNVPDVISFERDIDDGGAKSNNKFIRMLSSPGVKEYMHNTLVGKTEYFQALMNVEAFSQVEGYLGGLKVLLEFESVEIKNKFLSDGAAIWKPRFKNLTNLSLKCNYNERIT